MCLVEDNMKLVYKIANDYKGISPVELEDIIQEGFIGLVVAAKKYDSSKGAKFSTFAYTYIRGYILMALNEGYNEIKVPREVKELAAKIRKTEDRYLPPEELAVKYKCSAKHAKYVIDYVNKSIVRIDEKVNGELTLHEALGYELSFDEEIYKEQLLSQIDPKKRRIFEMVLKDYEVNELAEMFGYKKRSFHTTLYNLRQINKDTVRI